MTMHLAQGLDTTRTRKPKSKPVTPKELADYKIAWCRHNKDCRKRYLHSMQFKTVEEYIAYCRGEKYMPQKNPIPQFKTKVCEKTVVNKIPSHVSKTTGALSKPERKVYSGERKLVGIATMHKSNLVPVFEDEEGDARQEATELANMRR